MRRGGSFRGGRNGSSSSRGRGSSRSRKTTPDVTPSSPPTQPASVVVTSPPPPPPATSSHRLAYALASLVGRPVILTTRDNTVYRGILHTALPDVSTGVLGVSLRCATAISPTDASRQNALHDLLIIPPGELVSFSCANVPDPSLVPVIAQKKIRGGGGAGSSKRFATDSEISSVRNGTDIGSESENERELERWEPPEGSGVGENDDMLLEEGFKGRRVSGWDQFGTNRDLFGVTSTYSEDMYTTKIDRNSETYRKYAGVAERIAEELEATPAGNAHLREERGQSAQCEASEEDRYGAVLRDENQAPELLGKERYLPPHKRAGSVTVVPPPLQLSHQKLQGRASPPSPLSAPPCVAVKGTTTTSSSSQQLSAAPAGGGGGGGRHSARQTPLSPLAHSCESSPPAPSQSPSLPPDHPARSPISLNQTRVRSPPPRKSPPLASVVAAAERTASSGDLGASLGATPQLTGVARLTRSMILLEGCKRQRSHSLLPERAGGPRSPILTCSPQPGSPDPVLTERIRVRKALMADRFKASPTSGEGKSHSPMLSPMVDDAQSMQALHLEPSSPKVDRELYEKYARWTEAKRESTARSRDKILDDLRAFQAKALPRVIPGGVANQKRFRSDSVVAGRGTMTSSAGGFLQSVRPQPQLRLSPLSTVLSEPPPPAPEEPTTLAVAAPAAVSPPCDQKASDKKKGGKKRSTTPRIQTADPKKSQSPAAGATSPPPLQEPPSPRKTSQDAAVLVAAAPTPPAPQAPAKEPPAPTPAKPTPEVAPVPAPVPKLNPNAPSFSFNPEAATFMPKLFNPPPTVTPPAGVAAQPRVGPVFSRTPCKGEDLCRVMAEGLRRRIEQVNNVQSQWPENLDSQWPGFGSFSDYEVCDLDDFAGDDSEYPPESGDPTLPPSFLPGPPSVVPYPLVPQTRAPPQQPLVSSPAGAIPYLGMPPPPGFLIPPSFLPGGRVVAARPPPGMFSPYPPMGMFPYPPPSSAPPQVVPPRHPR